MPGTRKVIVIHSPHSGRSEQFSQALSYLRQANVEIAAQIAIHQLDATPTQGPQWVAQGLDAAVAAGGDGTVGGVITHIAHSGLPLGILPLGTSNDIARSLRTPQDLKQAAEVIARGKLADVDIGEAQPAKQAPHPASAKQGRPVPVQVDPQKHGFFAHALTTGLNVQFARLATNIVTRQRYGRLTYPYAAWEVLRNHKSLNLELDIRGLALAPKNAASIQSTPVLIEGPTKVGCRALQVAAINAPIFGGRWGLAVPGASLEDRLLDLIVLEDMDLKTISASLEKLFSRPEQKVEDPTGWHASSPELYQAELSNIPGFHHVRAREVVITTDIDPQDMTLDGEVRGQTPGHVRVAPVPLHVLVP